MRKIDGAFSTAKTFISYGFLALMFYFAFLMVDSLSGQVTFADIGIRMILDWRILAVLGTAGGVVYGIRERRLRQNTVKKLQPRIQQLEQLIDGGRSTSSLTATGETNPVDE
jgi:hypothetical protein